MCSKQKSRAKEYWFFKGQRRCAYCSCHMVWVKGYGNSATIEHMLPKSKGGTDALVNLILVCRRCNEKRSSKNFIAFVLGLPREEWLLSLYEKALKHYVKIKRRPTESFQQEICRIQSRG